MTPRPGDIVLVLRPLRSGEEVDFRLRRLLKTALRRDGLRCLLIRTIDQPLQEVADHDRDDARLPKVDGPGGGVSGGDAP